MGHASIPEPPGFSDLSKEEQIRYLQDWDRIADRPGSSAALKLTHPPL